MPLDKADITDAVGRLRDMNAALADWDRIRQEGEQISREEAYSVLTAEIAALRAENERRREEARRLTQRADASEDPMAYMAFATDGSESNAVYSTDGEAQAAADAWGWKVMPLYLAARLTDAERAAVEWCLGWCAGLHAKNHATLRGLLARLSGDGDCPAADNAAMRDNDRSQFAKRESDRSQPIANCDATPNTPSTPDECTVSPEWTSRPYYVDPPSGWRYGFPQLYDPQADGDMTEWLIANGYPEHLARQGLACTFSEYRLCTDSGEK